MVYLSPTPTAELAALFDDVLATFPDHPPYGGLHDTVVPHLTVSADGGPAQLAQVRAALADTARCRAETDRICVFGRGDDDVWRQSASVVLGSGDLAPHCL